MNMPPNCPLTQAQFDRLPIETQTSKTAIWIKDADNLDKETIGRIVAVLNHDALPAIAPYYFDLASLNPLVESSSSSDLPLEKASLNAS